MQSSGTVALQDLTIHSALIYVAVHATVLVRL